MQGKFDLKIETDTDFFIIDAVAGISDIVFQIDFSFIDHFH